MSKDSGAKPTVPYWHLHTDADGVSRQTRCAMTEFELKSMQPRPRRNGRATSIATA